MGFDITVYSLLEIIHKDGVAYVELAQKGIYTHYVYEERWDGEPRTKEQQRDFEDSFLEVDFLDSDEYQYLPMLLYKDYSQKHNDGEDDGDDEEIYKYYNKHNFIYTNHYEKYNSLLDTKIQDNIIGDSYLNEDDENYTDDDKRYNIIEKGGLLTSKDDILTIHKIIQKKWSP